MADIMTGDAMLPGRSALAGRAGVSTAAPDGSSVGLHVKEVAHIGKINIRGNKSIAKVIWNHTGGNFPPANNMVSSAGVRHIVWLGPDEALLLCEAGMERELQRKISEFLYIHLETLAKQAFLEMRYSLTFLLINFLFLKSQIISRFGEIKNLYFLCYPA